MAKPFRGWENVSLEMPFYSLALEQHKHPCIAWCWDNSFKLGTFLKKLPAGDIIKTPNLTSALQDSRKTLLSQWELTALEPSLKWKAFGQSSWKTECDCWLESWGTNHPVLFKHRRLQSYWGISHSRPH